MEPCQLSYTATALGAEGGVPVLLIIVAGMLLIILSADYFTNGVEWLGRLLGLADSAVGTLLAALGTALPETLVPVMAILLGTVRGAEGVGLGAILGAPFMLSTLGFLVLGLSVWWFRRPHLQVRAQAGPLRRDLAFFVSAFLASLLATWLPAPLHRAVGVLLVVAYMGFAWRVIHAEPGQDGEAPAPLHLWQRGRPPAWTVVGQVAMALGGLVVGAHFFVDAITELAQSSGINGFLLSVVLTPVATELPEVLNSVIWIRRGTDTLAFGNVTGALAFQASLVPALGLWFTPWRLSPIELAVGAVSALAALWVLSRVRTQGLKTGPLLAAGLFYLLFLAVAIARLP
jgi:cation:H+ antiporter